MRLILVGVAFAVLALTCPSILAGEAPLDPQPNTHVPVAEMKLWEAWWRGKATVVQETELSYKITNTGTVSILVDEYAMALSPNAAFPGDDGPGNDETQDGIFTFPHTLSPGTNLSYNYGDFVAHGFSPPPPWWCSEATEFTHAPVTINLAGQIAPFALWDDLATPDNNTQADVWNYLGAHPSVVVGKTPLYAELPGIGASLGITLTVTNIGGEDALGTYLLDTLPAGTSFDPASPSLPPASVTANPDGTTTLRWALGTMDGWDKAGPDDNATPYVSKQVNYSLILNAVADQRFELPRALVRNESGSALSDYAHSAKPIVEVLNLPPVARPGGPYFAPEGSPILFNASASSDVDGDPLTFLWDFDADGFWDTTSSSSPYATRTWGDDYTGQVTLGVSDGKVMTLGHAQVTVTNVNPTITIEGGTLVGQWDPRTIGYWKHQCTIEAPYGEQVGIQQAFIDYLGANSLLFAGYSTKAEVCDELENVTHSDMLDKAEQQLMATWLNLGSGKLETSTPVTMDPLLSNATTVGEAVLEAEAIVLSGGDLETAKDVADSINNGIGVTIFLVSIDLTVTDPGSDDETIEIDFGDGTVIVLPTVFRSGTTPDPPVSPDVNPVLHAMSASHGYSAGGSYSVMSTTTDDDSGLGSASINISL